MAFQLDVFPEQQIEPPAGGLEAIGYGGGQIEISLLGGASAASKIFPFGDLPRGSQRRSNVPFPLKRPGKEGREVVRSLLGQRLDPLALTGLIGLLSRLAALGPFPFVIAAEA